MKRTIFALLCGAVIAAGSIAVANSLHWVTDRVWEWNNSGWSAHFGVVTRNDDLSEDVSKCNIYHTFRNVGTDHPEVVKLLAEYKQACDRLEDDAKHWSVK